LDSIQHRNLWDATSSGLSQVPTPSSKYYTDMDDMEGSRSTIKPSSFGQNITDRWSSPFSSVSVDSPQVNEFSQVRISSRQEPAEASISHANRPKRKNYTDESTFVRPGSLKSSSMLRLADILCHHVLLHPFVALRRTCQVNRKCSAYVCVQPFTLVPFMFHQQRKQGLISLYKGLSSELLVKGLALGTETALANYMDWPRESSSKRYLEDSLKILALRGMSIALSTPFLCSAVIETVQSVIVVRDRPSFVECFREGFFRLLHLRSTPSNRIVPIWLLILPTVFYHVAHYAIWHLARNCIEFFKSYFLSPKRQKEWACSERRYKKYDSSLAEDSNWQHDLTSITESLETSVDQSDIEIDSNQISNSIIASLIADVTLLPIETILYSLYVQGTRTIIDNCDQTTVVLPVLTNYDGFVDCHQSIMRFEGSMGLFKGLGAIILQYSIHFFLFRSLHYLLKEIQSQGECKARKRSAPKQRTFENPRASSEFLQFHPGNRHSTPNNMTDNDRLRRTPYRLNATPLFQA